MTETGVTRLGAVLAASLRRSFRDKGFATLFVLTLALGVGANAALLSALRGYLVRPLPYRQAGALVVVNWRVPKLSPGTFPASIPIYRFLAGQKHDFSSAALANADQATVTAAGRSRNVPAEEITASLFTTLGVHPFLGRFFTSAADQPDGPAVAVVSYDYWQSALDSDPNAIGKTLVVNGVRRRIAAVMGPNTFFPRRDVTVYLPLRIAPTDAQPTQATQGRGTLVVRLAGGVHREALPALLQGLSGQFLGTLPATLEKGLVNAGFALTGRSLRTFLYGDTADRLGLIELGALVLLALAVVNLINLTLVRTLRRRHEIALRLALGANRRSLLGLAFSETLPLAIASWLVALGIAYAGTVVLRIFGIGADQTAFSIGIDPAIMAVGLGIALVGAALAILPLVLAPRRALLARLVEGPRGTASRGAGRLQRALSVAQVAFAVALLVNAALLGITLNNLSRLAPGFDPDHLVAATLTLQGPRFGDSKSTGQFDRTLLRRAKALPGVQDAVLSGGGFSVPFVNVRKPSLYSPGAPVAGRSRGQASRLQSAYVLLDGGDLLRTLGLSLLRGRDLDQGTAADAQGVLVDRRLALRFFGTTDVVGKTLVRGAGGQQLTIRGVVDHVLWGPPPITSDIGTVIMQYSQGDPQQPTLLIRTKASLAAIAPALRNVLKHLAPDQSFARIVSMRTLMNEALAPLAAPASLYGLFGLVALLLAAVGVYGVIAYRVRLRLPEFAVRQTLGASPARIVLLALGEGTWIAALGIGCGLVGGWWIHYLTGRAAGSAVPGALPFAATAAVMAAVILLAAFMPAVRASRVDLVGVLRPQ